MGEIDQIKIVKSIQSKKNKTITFRYPQMEDLDEMTRYINELSKEDTYILFSGEEITREFEQEFLSKTLKQIEAGDHALILAFSENKLVGISGVERITSNKKRGLHTGLFGISLAADHRDEGIGTELAKIVIEEAKQNIRGLKLIILDVFENNPKAQYLYQKLGFKNAGMIPGALMHKGEYIGEIKMYLEIQ